MNRLNLIDCHFTDLSVQFLNDDSSQDGNPKNDSIEMSLNLGSSLKKLDSPGTHHFVLQLKISIESGEREGLNLKANYEGLFEAPDFLSEDDAEKLVRTNGHALLYSTLRGELKHIASSFPGPKLVLPTIPVKLTPDKKKPVPKKKASKKRASKKKIAKKKSS
ncbi:MAG: hypothetical protein ACLFUS_04665 [Candidatus Sumerlaeia bacterium]